MKPDFDAIATQLVADGCFEFRSSVDGKWRKVKNPKSPPKRVDLAPHLMGEPGSPERVAALARHYENDKVENSPFVSDLADQLLHLANKNAAFADLLLGE